MTVAAGPGARPLAGGWWRPAGAAAGPGRSTRRMMVGIIKLQSSEKGNRAPHSRLPPPPPPRIPGTRDVINVPRLPVGAIGRNSMTPCVPVPLPAPWPRGGRRRGGAERGPRALDGTRNLKPHDHQVFSGVGRSRARRDRRRRRRCHRQASPAPAALQSTPEAATRNSPLR